MNTLQYSFVLESSHDMNAIRDRVRSKLHVVKDLAGLRWKAWLLSEPLPHRVQLKTYAPLYLFCSGEAAASFLLGPVFRGVTDAFGWCKPTSGLPIAVVDAAIQDARSCTVSVAEALSHEHLCELARSASGLEEGEVARVRVLAADRMALRTYRFWRVAPDRLLPPVQN